MLTKKDLSAIKELFSDRFDRIEKRFDVMNRVMNNISNKLDSNTKDLTDLILAGFTTHEKATFKSN
jgi:hypothetical protein